jgi:thymidylate kinase
MVLALEKRSKMRAAIRARNRGLVVICDRYPQVNVVGFNDGPLLAPWLESRSAWRRRWATWEHGVYAWTAASAPDLAIKLDVAPEVAVGRKPGTLAEAERRRAALRRIEFGSRCQHVVIDAGRPLDEVTLAVKRVIWDRL